MLALWREWGLDLILREAWQEGIVLAGVSAGSICWFEQGLSDSMKAGELQPMHCLGLLAGSNCPHYDWEAERRPQYQRLICEGKLRPGHAADDGAALHYVDGKLEKVVSSRATAKAYRVEWDGKQIVETVLETERLNSQN